MNHNTPEKASLIAQSLAQINILHSSHAKNVLTSELRSLSVCPSYSDSAQVASVAAKYVLLWLKNHHQ